MPHPDFHAPPLGDWHLSCRDPWAHIENLRNELADVRSYLLGDTNLTGLSIDSLMELLPNPDDYPDAD